MVRRQHRDALRATPDVILFGCTTESLPPLGGLSRRRGIAAVAWRRQRGALHADNDVRFAALQAIAAFRNATSTDALLRLYDALTDPQLKYQALVRLKEIQSRSNPPNRPPQIVEVVPVKAMPRLAQIAREGPTRELRQGAIQQLHAIPGEEATTLLVGVYEACVDSELKQLLVHCLGGRGDPVAAQKLVAIAQSDVDPRSRQVAVELLGRLPSNQNAVPPRSIPSRSVAVPPTPPPLR